MTKTDIQQPLRGVHYGCGWSAPLQWKNFDASPTLRFERLPMVGSFYTKNKKRFPKNIEYGDIVKGLPVSPDSVHVVYCSHILEHLALSDFRTAIQNTFDMLQPEGTFRFVLPDLEHMMDQYRRDGSPDAAINFMQNTILGIETRPRGLRAFLTSWLGNFRHLWMWDYKAIARELQQVGFVDIRRASYGDSAEPLFDEVEDEGRWTGCLGVECKKPK
jgi:hypothetical protein